MSENNIALKVAKIGILGDTTVGKSSICQTYSGKEFVGNTLFTIGFDRIESQFTTENGKEIKLIIFDTAGQERFHSVALNTIKSVNGIVLVSDLTNKESFDNITKWIKDVNDNLDNPCIVLFGNKADLPKEKWQVTSEEAQKYAEVNGLVYFETSAKTNVGITQGFAYIANQAYKRAEQKLKKDINNNDNNKNIVIGKTVKKKSDSGCCASKKKENKKNVNEVKGKVN